MSVIPDPATTDWVPLWNLGRQPIKYLGTYNAATTYNNGDVVIGPDGLAYVCVLDNTLGVAPGWGGSFPPLGASYGTSLPASPIDGQEAILVDSLTNPSWQWRFRYNAGSSSAYKWEFVGGLPYLTGPAGAVQLPADGSAVNLTSGPTVTVPRAGQYRVYFGGTPGTSNIFYGAFQTRIQVYDAGGTPYGNYIAKAHMVAPYDGATISGRIRNQVLAAGTVLNLRTWMDRPTSPSGGGSGVSDGILELTPERVS